ncbi:phage integrase SAM-like domain-containing protein [uncultured Rikenella sp.]|uniref:phage integrase SAM-like domain-containing protein n=1 Tax=uncultured Rikenella sp. TaxID=368003 RepID=UPI00260C24B2|nr:phage integrase SAM-like domain-containing protein [uncultured Rikenella sp.]
MTLHNKVLAGGRQSLYIDYCEGGKHRREFLSLYLEPENTVRIKRANASILRKAKAILRERQSAMLSAQLSQIEEQERRSTLLSSWLDTYYTYLERRGVDDLHSITSIKLRLQEYAPDATLEQVDKPFLLGFIDYLRGEYRMRNGEPLSQKSIFNLVGMLSSSLNYAVSIGRIAINPYNLFESEERVKRGNEHKREYLTIEELKRMIDTLCRSAVVRQVFLFTCFTGLRLSDVRGLRWCDLSQQDGAYTLGVKMYKTEKMVYIPLSK